jgi:AhpD family alkylhydroperoxidase
MEYWKVAHGGSKAKSSLETYLRDSGLDMRLLHMVKLSASQVNGCAYCIDMHWKDARAGGQSEQRYTASTPGAKPLTTPTAKAPPWNGRRR